MDLFSPLQIRSRRVFFRTNQIPSSSEWDGTLLIPISSDLVADEKEPVIVEKCSASISSVLLYGTTDQEETVDLCYPARNIRCQVKAITDQALVEKEREIHFDWKQDVHIGKGLFEREERTDEFIQSYRYSYDTEEVSFPIDWSADVGSIMKSLLVLDPSPHLRTNQTLFPQEKALLCLIQLELPRDLICSIFYPSSKEKEKRFVLNCAFSLETKIIYRID